MSFRTLKKNRRKSIRRSKRRTKHRTKHRTKRRSTHRTKRRSTHRTKRRSTRKINRRSNRRTKRRIKRRSNQKGGMQTRGAEPIARAHSREVDVSAGQSVVLAGPPSPIPEFSTLVGQLKLNVEAARKQIKTYLDISNHTLFRMFEKTYGHNDFFRDYSSLDEHSLVRNEDQVEGEIVRQAKTAIVMLRDEEGVAMTGLSELEIPQELVEIFSKMDTLFDLGVDPNDPRCISLLYDFCNPNRQGDYIKKEQECSQIINRKLDKLLKYHILT